MNTENPINAVIFEMTERDEYSVSEISEQTGVTKRNEYYNLERAKAIRQEYNR